MKKTTKIVYVELKSGYNDNGPAWIGKAYFSKTGKTVYFNGKAFQSSKGRGTYSNFYEIESGEDYWISGVKKDGTDRHWSGSGKIFIDRQVIDEYLKFINRKELPKNKFEIVDIDNNPPKERIREVENETLEPTFDYSLMYKKPSDLNDDQLLKVYEELLSENINETHLKARKMWKEKVKDTEEEIERRKIKTPYNTA